MTDRIQSELEKKLSKMTPQDRCLVSILPREGDEMESFNPDGTRDYSNGATGILTYLSRKGCDCKITDYAIHTQLTKEQIYEISMHPCVKKVEHCDKKY